MQIIQGIRSIQTPFSGSVLTIGNFDGVHLGHRELLRRVVACAKTRQQPSVVMTFEPHPVKVLYPDRHLHRIFSLEDQIEQLAACSIDALVIEPFSREFSQLPPERYLQEWIFRPFLPEAVVVGYDFSFGANRGGSIDFLKSHAATLGLEVEVVSPVKVGDVLVSSTRIRTAIESGDVTLAERLLGRRFYLSGLVVRGAGRGRTIGVPTANLRSSAETVPARGVYAAWAEVRNRRFKAAVNIGTNPTFTGTGTDQTSLPAAKTIEAHLLVEDGEVPVGDLYGELVTLRFQERLRDERKFPSATALVAQIGLDIERARALLVDRGVPLG